MINSKRSDHYVPLCWIWAKFGQNGCFTTTQSWVAVDLQCPVEKWAKFIILVIVELIMGEIDPLDVAHSVVEEQTIPPPQPTPQQQQQPQLMSKEVTPPPHK